MEWRDIPIFISSTFNDMHAERDYLVKNVFPELTEWCEKYKLRLIDIDLRWGVTSSDSEAKNTVQVCLDNINKCRPFFLCFLGQRRGWIPKRNVIAETTYDVYPDLQMFVENKSVTEMEIEHALLSPMYEIVAGKRKDFDPVNHALFFFREDIFTNQLTENQRKIYTNDAVLEENGNPKEEDEKLSDFKQEISNHWEKVTEYTCKWNTTVQTPELLTEKNGEEIAQGRLVEFKANGLELKNVIIEKLKDEIKNDKRFKERFLEEKIDTTEKTPFEIAYQNDLEQQELFNRLNSEGYIPRNDVIEKLNNYVKNSDNSIFLLTAKAGMGKTMLLANYAKELKGKGLNIYARFCGISDLSSEQYTLWKSIFQEIGIETPPTLNELKQQMTFLLNEIVKNGKVIILIDAVNQIYDGTNMLSWLPQELPEGLKLIISLKEDDEYMLFIQKHELKEDNIYSVPPFENKIDFIHHFLERYLKALDDEKIKTICNLPYSDNPLFLKILLHELRMFGAFKQLQEEIERYGDKTETAFKAILERLETDSAYDVIEPEESVPFLFGLLAYSRKGLSINELSKCFSIKFPKTSEEKIHNTINFYLRQVRPFMARRERRSDFLYESFMIAAKERYNTKENWHSLLSESLFFTRPGECAWHTRMSGKSERLRSIYTDLDFLNRYYLSDGAYHLKAEIQNVEPNIITPSIKEFINNTAILLEQYPDSAMPYMYKELPQEFKSEAERLCKSTWIKLDKIDISTPPSALGTLSPSLIKEMPIFAKCFASETKEAFLLTEENQVQVIDLQTMNCKSVFPLNKEMVIGFMSIDSTGQYLAIGSAGQVYVFFITWDSKRQFIRKDCIYQNLYLTQKFGGANIFALSEGLFFQTPEKICVRIFYSNGQCKEKQDNRFIQETLAVYFQISDREYYVSKTQNVYKINNGIAVLELQYPVRSIVELENHLCIIPKNRSLLFCDKDTLQIKKELNLSEEPQSCVAFGEGLLFTDKHGEIFTWNRGNEVLSNGMLSIDIYDIFSHLFVIDSQRVFFVSSRRYALLEKSNESKITVINAKKQNGQMAVLLFESGNKFSLLIEEKATAIETSVLSSEYGLASTANLKCDWNSVGDVIYTETRTDCKYIHGNGNHHSLLQSHSPVINVYWLGTMNCFAVLYHSGELKFIGNEDYTIQVPQSSTGNYLFCDCGNHFCVVSKRVLITPYMCNTYEETTVSIYDKDAKLKKEFHFHLQNEPKVNDLCYDTVKNQLHLLRESCIHSILLDNYSEKIVECNVVQIGSAAYDGIIYKMTWPNSLRTIDSITGKDICIMPSHRSITKIIPVSDSTVLVIENNEVLYSCNLKK